MRNPLVPTVTVSFHDLAPHSRQACEQFFELMRQAGIPRTTLLVVPRWYGGPPLHEQADFVAWLRQCEAAGHEIQLHGQTHRADEIAGGLWTRWVGTVYTAREGEFQSLPEADARERVSDGLAMLRGLGFSVNGFTAPAWLLSPSARQALIGLGVDYTTYLQHVEDLRTQRRYYAPTLVFSCRKAWRRVVSLGWVRVWDRWNDRAPHLRLSVHPGDLQFPAVRESILRLLRRARHRRTPVTYAELIHMLDAAHPRLQ